MIQAFDKEWTKLTQNQAIIDNKLYFENLFMDIWINVYMTLGSEACETMDILTFSEHYLVKKSIIPFNKKKF